MPPRRAATRTAAIKAEDVDEEPPTRSKRVARSVSVSVAESDHDGANTASDVSDDSDPKPKKKPAKKAAKAPAKRAAPKATTTTSTKARKAAKALADEDDDEEEEKQEDVFATPKPVVKSRAKAPVKKSKVAKPAASQQSSRAPNTTPLPRTPRPTAKRPDPVALDEEENIVLESPTRRPLVIPSPVKLEVVEDKGPRPRLVIHKIVLVNFKSYAGRQEIGPFHKSFSAIVGPNGSGKSNTIDALLFVFGYRASKMRQGKLSELIHNSANYPDLDECRVEVHFREIIDLPGPDAFEVVPKSSLVVARSAFKNNSSRYTINNRASNFNEVTTLLKARGIDLDHKRFLILQGEVESIAQMKPKAQTEHDEGLLEYLEDIIGTSVYKQPIEDAFAELDKLGEERSEKLNRLRLVEREKQSLEADKKEADDFLRNSNEYARVQSRLFQWHMYQTQLKIDQCAHKMDELQAELVAQTEANKEHIQQSEELQEHYNNQEKKLKRADCEEEAETATAHLSSQTKREVELTERKKVADAKIKKCTKSIAEDKASKSEADHSIRHNSEILERSQAEVDKLEESLAQEEKKLEDIVDSLKDKTQVFTKQIEAKQRELQPWSAKLRHKEGEIKIAQNEQDSLKRKVEAVKTAGTEAKAALEALRTEKASKENDKNQVQQEKAEAQRELADKQRSFETLRGELVNLRGKASASQQKVEEARASQAQNRSANAVLDSLTKLSQTGRVQGFHGRLGSLGTIPDEYDVAISTACGILNNLVVDTVEQAQTCIEYLRSQNIGRASFIALNKLPKQTYERIETPEGVPRLFDLIKPKDPKYLPAFWKGVSNTLVAKDLQQANRIAYGAKRWRVVTLAGQLIDTSGTMSGGGNKPMKGLMSSKLASDSVQPEVLKRFEKESEQDALAVANAISALARLESEIDDLKGKGPALDLALQKLNMDLGVSVQRIQEAEKRLRELEKQSKPDQADIQRIAVLEKEIERSQRELEQLTRDSAAIEQAIQELQEKILDVGGVRLRAQKSKVDGIRQMLDLENDKITKAEVHLAKARKDAEKYAKSLAANEEALEASAEVLEQLQNELSVVKSDVAGVQKTVDAANSRFELAKDELDAIKAELEEKLELTREFRKKENEIKTALKDAEKELKENQQRHSTYKERHDKLELQEIDEDEEDEAAAAAEAEKKKQDAMDEDEDENKMEVDPPTKTDPYQFYWYTPEELESFSQRQLVADVALYEERVRTAKPNMDVLKQYRKREQEFLARAQDLDAVTAKRDACKKHYDDLRKKRLEEFMSGFNQISSKLKEMYQMITLGGNAELELVDSMDPFSEGIIFSVMPPKKSWKNISNLSGGEKTLSSLALVFALHVFKPTPLYFMDEIDAALDFRNVSIVANYIKDRTKNAQFIIISLRNNMFELSHRLIGIYKTSNATRSITIDNHDLNRAPSVST
ncbi:Structural maintenance of chromosomes protein 4 [Serendipita indica DSM 11827]|nr:Structural maintenance of chromosomes protein 4 [Serendipita indica DSM 11827]